ncbi:hypothetical protein L7F22_024738 [Adiantum nelumboides]|nr:hypothetical protein [Adiantum nelumboides]
MATAVQLHGHPLPPHVSLLPLSFQINRQRISVSPHDTTVAWDSTLLEYLRDHVRLTGTKLGCGEGGCGACTVVVLRPKSRAQLQREQEHDVGNGLPYDIRAVNSCLMPLIAVHGCQVSRETGPIPFAFLFGSQCGFCTPGIIMSFYATLRNAGKRGLSERDIERGMDGNLCRCTGYRPILDALKTFAKASETADDDEDFNGLEAVTANSQQQQLSCSSPAESLAEAFRESSSICCRSIQSPGLSRIMSNISHFASTQIRNVACVGGNVATASPISDLNPVWLALNSEVRYIDALKLSEDDVLGEDDAFLERLEGRISMSNFFRGYRKTALPAGAVITRIVVSLPPPPDPNGTQETRRFTRAYKQAKRVDDDIATVTCCLYLEVEAGSPDLGQSWTVREARFAYGGMAPTTVLARRRPKKWDGFLSQSASAQLFRQIWSEVTEELQSEVKVRSSLPSAFKGLSRSALVRPVTRGSQDFEQVQVKVKGGSGGRISRCTSLDDDGQCRIVSIDATPALMPNGPALRFVEENDLVKLGGRNAFLFDDRFFAGSRSEAVGMVIGVVLAKTKRLAQAAARMVKVEYERLGPPVLDIDSAISAESFLTPRPKIQTATNEGFDDWSDCEHVLDGTTRLGGQSHFYLETNACLVVPSKEGDDMEVWSSTQNPSETQAFVSEALCIPMSHINVRVKRIGGGFGGKETRSVILAAVMAVASKFQVDLFAVNSTVTRTCCSTVKRHPFKGEWRIGMTRTGKFKKFDVKVYNNAGHSQDLSRAVLERAMFHIDGCYRWPALRVRGWMCRTHTVSNTAFRGFGGRRGREGRHLYGHCSKHQSGIDVGQIEGAFTQGLGLVTIEESLWKPNGDLVTKGPGNYKIPAFLYAHFFHGKPAMGGKMHHLRTVQGSKGVGEPPLTLGCFHFFAIKDAVRSARIDHGLPKATLIWTLPQHRKGSD